MLNGWTWRNPNAKATADKNGSVGVVQEREEEKREEKNDGDDKEVKEESSRYAEREAPAAAVVSEQPMLENPNNTFAGLQTLHNDGLHAGREALVVTGVLTHLIPKISNDTSASINQIQSNKVDVEQEPQLPGENEQENRPAPSSAKDDDVLLIEIKNPDMFSSSSNSPVDTRSADDIKPVMRIETVQTKTGTKKRKLVGPFVFEDDENSLFCSPDDEGYGSFSNDRGLEPNGNNDRDKTSRFSPDLSSTGSADRDSRKTMMNEMERYRRRKLSEDKCAEVSRRMREEAIAKRKAERYPSGAKSMALSRAVIDDGSDGSVVGAVMSSSHRLRAILSPKTSEKVDNDDDLFGDISLPEDDNTEVQLDLAQEFAHSDNRNDDLPSSKDLTRSSSSSGSLVEDQEADNVVSSSGSRINDREEIMNLGSIPSPEKLLDGEVGRTVTSGVEHYDREQAEKYWKKVNKLDRRNEKWPRMIQFEHIDEPNSHKYSDEEAVDNIVDGVRAVDEARLLAAKEAPPPANGSLRSPKQPLKAAPNVNGGLARLVRKAVENAKDESRGIPSGTHKQSKGSQYPTSPTLRDGPQDRPVEEGNWINGGSLRERKRDIENLMSAFEEAARCWCLAFDSMKPIFQTYMKADVDQLRAFADRILQGYCTKDKNVKKMSSIKNNMRRRIKIGQDLKGFDQKPSQQEIQERLRRLMGEKRFRRANQLLNEVLTEHNEYRPKTRSHHKGGRSKTNSNSNRSSRSGPVTLSGEGLDEVEVINFESDEEDPYREFNLNPRQRAAWEYQDAKIEKMKQQLARLNESVEPKRSDYQKKKVHFADTVPWAQDFDHAKSSESEISDEDEDENAPSFGRGKANDVSLEPMTDPGMEGIEPPRRTFGGKGLLSEARKEDEISKGTDQLPVRTTVGRKRLISQTEDVPSDKDRRDLQVPGRRDFGGKSVSNPSMLSLKRSMAQCDFSDIEESEYDAQEFEFDAEGSPSDEDNADMYDLYDGLHLPQYNIVADYDDFDDYVDDSVTLGTHIDIHAALRQMTRITTDIAGWASRKYRKLRIIWDTDDFELAAQTVILPTAGECRVRMVKSWVPAQDWPGKSRPKELGAPKVFYVVHESKTTLLRPLPEMGRDNAEEELFEPDDFEDPKAVVGNVEHERDMCFSSRQCANEIAKNRLRAFTGRYNTADDEEDAESSNPGLDEYMQQIENDRACFMQEKTVSTVNKDGRKGKERIHIWVEDMVADMPHT